MKKFDKTGREIPDQTPVVIEHDIKKPLTIEEQIKKQLLRREYFANLQAMAGKANAGEDIDDEYQSDEEAFTAAEAEYVKSQEDFKQKKQKFFEAAAEKRASELALNEQNHKNKIKAEAEKLGILKKETDI